MISSVLIFIGPQRSFGKSLLEGKCLVGVVVVGVVGAGGAGGGGQLVKTTK